MATPALPLAWQQILAGQAHEIVFGRVTVTFPSDKFCKNYVDSHVLTKVQSIAGGPPGVVGGVRIGGNPVSHAHVHGNSGIAYLWSNDTSLRIVASGAKSNRGGKDSGGYEWTLK